ncbi:MAG: hypothetical protein J1E31_06675 [Helicobacter sp.]|nr:hypothetical protein [Helicobacter sp.]
MLILNHSLVGELSLKFITQKEEITHSLPQDFLILDSLELAKFCNEAQIEYAALPKTTTEALFFVNLGAKYLCFKDSNFAKTMQNLAEVYLFDTKILCVITKESQIEQIAQSGIDGVIFWKH